MHVALFGGSFNPPHLGHVLCVLYAYKIAQVDQVWILPAINHPYGKELLAWQDRWDMCVAAFAGLEFVRLCDDELHNESGKTFDLLQQLKEKHVNNTWSFIGGTDTQNDMPQWYRGDELLQQLEIIAVPRQGFDDTSDAALPAISSSLVRERLTAGYSVSGLLPKGVIDLIDTHKWYK